MRAGASRPSSRFVYPSHDRLGAGDIIWDSPVEAISFLFLAKWRTSLGRFVRCWASSCLALKESLFESSLTEATRETPLDVIFPMPLPFHEAWSRMCAHERSASPNVQPVRNRCVSAQNLVNLQVGLFNYYELNCPRNCTKGRMLYATLNPLQKEIVERLRGHAHRFVSATGGEIPSVGRGKGRIARQLEVLTQQRSSQQSLDWSQLGANTTSSPCRT